MTNIELETLTAIKNAAKKFANRDIDWEERRYELAKELAPAMIMRNHVSFPTKETVAELSVEYADAIIEKLRKTV